MANESLFMTMDASKLQDDLVQLLGRTVRGNGRIEITDLEGGSCVMISKEELDSLERALEILYNTDRGQAMQRTVQQYARLSDVEADAVASA